mgnify:CR=1 FL=1
MANRKVYVMEKVSVNIDGTDYDIEVIRSIRRTISLEITSVGIRLRIPRRLSDLERDIFLQKHAGWLKKKLAARTKRQQGDGYGDIDDVKPFSGMGTDRFPVYAELPAKDKAVIKKAFEDRVSYYADIMGVSYNRITIRDQKTRWGSCSSKGNLNFNFRLYYMPQHLMDYVIVHELSHRRHMDHSKEFWNEVGRFYPEYKKCVEELRIAGSDIHG